MVSAFLTVTGEHCIARCSILFRSQLKAPWANMNRLKNFAAVLSLVSMFSCVATMPMSRRVSSACLEFSTARSSKPPFIKPAKMELLKMIDNS